MSFHDVRFPAALSVGSSGGPERRTEIVTLSNGFEERNSPWAHSRRRYDAGLGVRSLDDLAEVVAFFEARHGQLHGFRWKDWTDHSSPAAPSATPAALDQRIGTGDGSTTVFALVQALCVGGAGLPAADHQAGRRARCGWRSAAWRWRRGPTSSSITRPARCISAAAPGDGRAGDGGVRVRRAGALRHRPDRGEPTRGSRRGRSRRSRSSRCGSDARRSIRSCRRGSTAGRRRSAAAGGCGGATGSSSGSPTTTAT